MAEPENGGVRRRGVSVVICCYNSRARLRPTLEHLARQEVRPGLPWEVVVVDNASTDGTAAFARECWRGVGAAPLRVVREAEPGLSAARFRGLREARYEIVSFIDDDNWVCSGWVDRVDEIMAARPEVGACGGYNHPVFEGEPPAWFPVYQHRFAVGPQAEAAGDITDTKGVLWGAGLSLRRSAMLRLVDLGFRPLTTDRRGAALSSGGDYEICLALRLAGHRLFYDPTLEIRHFLPASRLRWRYLRRLVRENAASKVHRDAYRFLLDPRYQAKGWWWRTWVWHAAQGVRALLRHPLRSLRSLLAEREGDPAALYFEGSRGRLATILRERGQYGARARALRSAPWLGAGRGGRTGSETHPGT
jgi:glycosyltransferase involved in cell wall biosynthesis